MHDLVFNIICEWRVSVSQQGYTADQSHILFSQATK
jgi:hypothetical protein